MHFNNLCFDGVLKHLAEEAANRVWSHFGSNIWTVSVFIVYFVCVELAVIAEAHQAPTCVYVIQVVVERRDLCLAMSSGLVFAFHKEQSYLAITGENDMDLGRVQGPSPQLA